MFLAVAAIATPSVKLLKGSTLRVTLSLRCKYAVIFAMVSFREFHSCIFYSVAISRFLVVPKPFKYEAQTALFKNPVRTAQ